MAFEVWSTGGINIVWVGFRPDHELHHTSPQDKNGTPHFNIEILIGSPIIPELLQLLARISKKVIDAWFLDFITWVRTSFKLHILQIAGLMVLSVQRIIAFQCPKCKPT